MVPGAGLEPARLAAGDFESPESTNFTTRAVSCEEINYGTDQTRTLGLKKLFEWDLPLSLQCPLGGSTFFTSSTGTLIFLGMGVRHFPEPELL